MSNFIRRQAGPFPYLERPTAMGTSDAPSVILRRSRNSGVLLHCYELLSICRVDSEKAQRFQAALELLRDCDGHDGTAGALMNSSGDHQSYFAFG